MYDLIVGDEAWDVDHFWHENPELKRGIARLDDRLRRLPPDARRRRPRGVPHADYNAEMIEHIANFPRIRDRSIFVGNPNDVVADSFGPDLPTIRDWTETHFDFSGYIAGFSPPTADEVAEWRAELGYRDDELICVVTVGGSGVGQDLLEKAIAAHPIARRRLPELRTIAVAGPRIDPRSAPPHPGLEVHGYVDRLYRHLAVCDLADRAGRPDDHDGAHRRQAAVPLLPARPPLRAELPRPPPPRPVRRGSAMDFATTDPERLADTIVSHDRHAGRVPRRRGRRIAACRLPDRIPDLRPRRSDPPDRSRTVWRRWRCSSILAPSGAGPSRSTSRCAMRSSRVGKFTCSPESSSRPACRSLRGSGPPVSTRRSGRDPSRIPRRIPPRWRVPVDNRWARRRSPSMLAACRRYR